MRDNTSSIFRRDVNKVCLKNSNTRSAGRRMKLGSPGVALECSQTKSEFFYKTMYLILFISFRWINQTVTMPILTKQKIIQSNRPDLTTNSFLEKKCFQLRFIWCHQKRARNNKRDSAYKYLNKASMITIYIQKQ